MSAAALEELPPTPSFDLDPELPSRGPDAPPGAVTVCVGHALDLVEAF